MTSFSRARGTGRETFEKVRDRRLNLQSLHRSRQYDPQDRPDSSLKRAESTVLGGKSGKKAAAVQFDPEGKFEPSIEPDLGNEVGTDPSHSEGEEPEVNLDGGNF